MSNEETTNTEEPRAQALAMRAGGRKKAAAKKDRAEEGRTEEGWTQGRAEEEGRRP